MWLTNFSENRVEHDILVWISDPESGVGNVKSDVLNRIWMLFRDHGITIPYPQRVIHDPNRALLQSSNISASKDNMQQ